MLMLTGFYRKSEMNKYCLQSFGMKLVSRILTFQGASSGVGPGFYFSGNRENTKNSEKMGGPDFSHIPPPFPLNLPITRSVVYR